MFLYGSLRFDRFASNGSSTGKLSPFETAEVIARDIRLYRTVQDTLFYVFLDTYSVWTFEINSSFLTIRLKSINLTNDEVLKNLFFPAY